MGNLSETFESTKDIAKSAEMPSTLSTEDKENTKPTSPTARKNAKEPSPSKPGKAKPLSQSATTRKTTKRSPLSKSDKTNVSSKASTPSKPAKTNTKPPTPASDNAKSKAKSRKTPDKMKAKSSSSKTPVKLEAKPTSRKTPIKLEAKSTSRKTSDKLKTKPTSRVTPEKKSRPKMSTEDIKIDAESKKTPKMAEPTKVEQKSAEQKEMSVDDLIDEISKIDLNSENSEWLTSCEALSSIRDVPSLPSRRPAVCKYPISEARVPWTPPQDGVNIDETTLTARVMARMDSQKHTMVESEQAEVKKRTRRIRALSARLARIHSKKEEKQKEEEATGSQKDFQEASALWEEYFALKASLKKKSLPEFKADVDYSGSSPHWNVAYFSRFLRPSDVLPFTPVTTPAAPPKVHSAVVTRIRALLKCVHGWEAPKRGRSPKSEPDLRQTGLAEMRRIPVLEQTSRLFIDVVLLILSAELKITMSTEESLRSARLPNNKFDYLLFARGAFLGVAEAKREGVDLAKGFVQIALQLLTLHAVAGEEAHLPLVGVLTTGAKYVFVVLTARAFRVSAVFDACTVGGLQRTVDALWNVLQRNFSESDNIC
eukprot:270261_1